MLHLQRIKREMVIVVSCVTCGSALGTPIRWEANGHYYEFFGPFDPQVARDAANLSAEAEVWGVQGHLATIESQAENDFILSILPPDPDRGGGWIGGFQAPGTGEPNDGWEWVTGETWDYANWCSGEPNNGPGGNEDYLQFRWTDGSGCWNDEDSAQTYFIVEYDTTTPVPTLSEWAVVAMTLLLMAAGTIVFARRRKPSLG